MVEPDNPTDLTALVRELVVAAERFRVRKARATAGMGTTELTALGGINAAGPSTPTEIARNLQLTTPSVTELIDRLERIALVRRVPHATDRRKVLVELTPAGRDVVGDATGEFGTAVEQGAIELSPIEREALSRFLRTTSDSLDRLE